MTGEITLTGRLLQIGGVKEKVLAAYRNKMTDVLLPEMNRKDIDELPEEVRSALSFHFAGSIREALMVLFGDGVSIPVEVEEEAGKAAQAAKN
jgi:ATP-dependent Lon protease